MIFKHCALIVDSLFVGLLTKPSISRLRNCYHDCLESYGKKVSLDHHLNKGREGERGQKKGQTRALTNQDILFHAMMAIMQECRLHLRFWCIFRKNFTVLSTLQKYF